MSSSATNTQTGASSIAAVSTAARSGSAREPILVSGFANCVQQNLLSGDPQDDHGAVVLERFAPAVRDGVQDRQRRGRGGGRFDAGDRCSYAVEPERSAALDAPVDDPV